MTIVPAAEAVHLVVREIHHLARVYSLYDVAQILLAGRERYHLCFELSNKAPSIFKSRKDGSLWLTKEEAIAHFWNSPAAGEMYESEEIETDPPAGNFQVVARCGMSGEWLGPPNFHAYQTTLRRIHREQFSHMAFEFYSSRVRTERGEEAVNAWLDTMRKRVRWRLKRAAEVTAIPDPEPVAEVPAERTICAPLPICNSMQCTTEPTGMFLIGKVLPTRIGASAPLMMLAPTSRPRGAMM